MGGNLLQYSELRVEGETRQGKKKDRKNNTRKGRKPKEGQIGATDSSDKRQSESTIDRWTSRPDQASATPNETRHESTHTLEKHGDFGGNTNELFAPEFVSLVPQEFNERDQGSPWVGTVDDETLQENTSHHLTEAVVLDLDEKVE